MIYPDLETHRRASETFDFRPSNLEKNYNKIFARAPALTKDLLEKMNAEIVPKKARLCGHEIKKIAFMCGLFLLFFTSLMGTIAMWFTTFFDDTVLSTAVISNTSENFAFWAKPTPKALMKVHIFNYTNLEDYQSKMDDKLRVEEVGPYIYEETMERVNVKFNQDDTVSYQEKRGYKFRPDLTKARQSDRVNVPNIPLMTGASMTRYHNYFARLAFSSFLSGLDEKPFVSLAADSFILGYEDQLFDFSKTLAKLNAQKMPEKFGLLSAKIGLQPHVFTMNTGKKNIERLGVIEKFNGMDHFDYWSTDECNRVDSADGAMFPPKLVQQKLPLFYLMPQMCRAMPVVFDKEDTVLDGKIPSYRYIVPDDIYDSVQEKPEHQCYCSMDSGECPMKGLFNATPCSLGAPLFISNPHFYNADKSLLSAVAGLSTEKRDVQTYLNLHPTMGFIMSGRTVLQVNIQIQKAYGVYQLDRYDNGLVLPVAWMEAELDDKTLPQDYLNIIYMSTFTLNRARLAFKFGFLLTTVITLVCILLVVRSRWSSRGRDSRRVLQNQESVVEEI